MNENNIQSSDDMIDEFSLMAALDDPAGWKRPPASFADSARAYLAAPVARAKARRRRAERLRRIAAGFSVMVGLALFASWIVFEDSDSEEIQPVDAETAAITRIVKEEDNTMIARKAAGLVGAAMLSVSVPAAELMSESTFVFLRPETSSFWNTATNNVMTVPIDFPSGAKSASLKVVGLGYSRTYDGITEASYTFELPEPTSPEAENVYDLTLTFDDSTVRRAKLGLIQGLSPDGEGVTRCIAPAEGKVWAKVKGKAVLPIPYGTTSFTINGAETPTGLNGAQGWYPIRIPGRSSVSLSLIANEINYTAELVGGAGGTLVILR